MAEIGHFVVKLAILAPKLSQCKWPQCHQLPPSHAIWWAHTTNMPLHFGWRGMDLFQLSGRNCPLCGQIGHFGAKTSRWKWPHATSCPHPMQFRGHSTTNMPLHFGWRQTDLFQLSIVAEYWPIFVAKWSKWPFWRQN